MASDRRIPTPAADTAHGAETRAVRHLSGDPVMAELIATLPPPKPGTSAGLYIDLVDAIASQQLSVRAAASIMDRFLDLFPDRRPTPEEVLERSDEELRAVGLSRPKVRYIRGIAEAISSGEFDLERLHDLPDDEVIEHLTALKGVGRWTAEMLLIFSLRRPDVFSLGDLGLRNAVARHYGVDRDDHEAIRAISERWSPHRSTASRYLWASLANTPVSDSR